MLDHANPPSLMLTIETLLNKFHKLKAANNSVPHIETSNLEVGVASASVQEKYALFFNHMWPLLQRYYAWFHNSQSGFLPHSFRWRGRTQNHTLASGLDDYPRALNPSEGELHVDLQSWMVKSSQIMMNIAKVLNKDSKPYEDDYENRKKALDEIHWNEPARLYCDVEFVPVDPNNTQGEKRKEFLEYRGYLSLFPFLLGIIPKESSKLQATLDLLKDPKHLWSSYGIRSLSASDPLFGTGENYWKGPIWMNINYLVLSALHNHYIHEGPYKEEALQLYNQLRNNIINNMFQNYKNTGFVWEQYNPGNGQGQRCHPFNGWSSLVLLIMAEMY